MPGRKNPDVTDEEKKRGYRLEQKRGYGDTVAGEEAGFLDEMGPAAEVRHEREEWQKDRQARTNENK